MSFGKPEDRQVTAEWERDKKRTYTASRAVTGHEIGKKLEAAGIMPRETRRIIIDIKPSEPVKIYYECFADKQILDLVLEDLIGDKCHEIAK